MVPRLLPHQVKSKAGERNQGDPMSPRRKVEINAHYLPIMQINCKEKVRFAVNHTRTKINESECVA